MLIGTSVFSGIAVNRSSGRLISGSDEVWELYSSGDKQGAYLRAQALEREWDSFRPEASVMLDNRKLSEIDRICSRIVYLVEGDSEELHSELTELRHMAEALRSGERLTVTSVL
ncbi:MAG: DUF4363 family protein, partial [Ruminococcus sp.]|nr:DUF4363 family protein [Ruminococcus sp.]